MERHETDFLVVGSGAAGMTAAIAARREGLETLLIEKTPLVGGSTALSGGGIWVPNNHLMEAAGIPDSFENGCRYLEHTVGSRTPRARQQAYVRFAREMLRYLDQQVGIRFRLMDGFPDYYPERPGGVVSGRSVCIPLFVGQRLGRDLRLLRDHEYEAAKRIPLSLLEFRRFVLLRTHPRFFLAAMRPVLRAAFNHLFRRHHLVMGRALAAALFQALRREGVALWLETVLEDLQLEGGRVVGAAAVRAGRRIEIRARRGVLLAAGGFARHPAMRECHLPKPTRVEWSCTAPGDTGDAIRLAERIGAALDLLDDAWWGPVWVVPGEPPVFLLVERACPGSLLVSSTGQRFVNESCSYVDLVHAMYERNGRDGTTVPAHFVFDHRFRSRYFLGLLAPGFTPRRVLENGALRRAASLRELAAASGIDPDGLEATVARFNEFARQGKDRDFQRGESAFDRSYADPHVRPNPCLAPIEHPPFYALPVYPGDIGTKGGVVTNEWAQALRPDGSVIEGLYAAGNCAASVMGRTYPGGGATLGPAMTFGFLAALHAAGRLGPAVEQQDPP